MLSVIPKNEKREKVFKGNSFSSCIQKQDGRGQFLRGLASLRVENSNDRIDKIETIDTEIIDHPRRLEDPEAINVKELTELVRLLDNKLITPDEYDKAKQKIFNS
ncbi:MAG: hypothetical protein JRI91_14355 [Deltaproteobacteria bacterium]|nr:hypothetical protein [Deltaproteobacteria bacterium]